MATATPLTLLIISFLLPNYLLHGASALCHEDDEAGLLGFKSGIKSDPSGILSTWKRGTNCCKWLGVSCGDNNRVETLSVSGDPNNPKGYLTGTISPSLAKLHYMSTLFFQDLGNVSGTFPRFLFDLVNLQKVNIDNCKLSGPLPADIGRLSRFSTLSLEGNRFTGSIPNSISQLTEIRTLRLGENLLVGLFPGGIQKLTSLTLLDLSHNQLSGKIPSVFNSLSYLRVLILSHNKFSGEISAFISSLTIDLEILDLGHNLLTGKIPVSFGNNLTSLDTLDLSSNHFSGVVPKSFENLNKIFNLNLSRNKLIGPFPKMNGKGFVTLDLSYNQFKLGKFPTWAYATYQGSLKLARCGIKMKFEDFKPVEPSYYNNIDFSDNQITGSPVRLLNETNFLMGFSASRNQLRFNMSDLKLSETLKYLDLSRNQIFGKVPVSISRLKTVNVSHNHLCGKIPVTKFPVSSFQGNDCLCGSPLPQCKS